MLHSRIPLWENSGFSYDNSDGFFPTMDTYILDSEHPRGLVVICPGGGYEWKSPREAEPIAMQFTAAGWHAAVLWYSVAPHRHPQPLQDLSRAMCLLREHAEAWRIDPERIAVCGFSAGGHLAASLGVHWQQPYLQETPGIQAGKNRPDALILSYPVITSGEFRHHGSIQNLLGDAIDDSKLLRDVSLEYHVGPQTPPSFLWHTVADSSVPLENSLLFIQALRRHNIPFECHFYPKGGHGLSLATPETARADLPPDSHVASWMPLCLEWLSELFCPL